MKTKEELIKKHEFKLDGRWALDRPDVEEILDEYAEEYAKAFYKHVIYKWTGYAPDDDIIEARIAELKESLKK